MLNREPLGGSLYSESRFETKTLHLSKLIKVSNVEKAMLSNSHTEMIHTQINNEVQYKSHRSPLKAIL